MTAFRTPDDRFDALPDFPFTPHYLEWNGLRVHHLDEGPRDAPVVLLMHGEPTWSYLYRHWVAPLVALGYRVVAPDHVGFGRSDKPVDDDFYVIERHCERIRHLIDTLDLRRISIVVQDWGGPTGLRQVCDQPERFERVFILNTWLHHEGYEYSDGIRFWRQMALDPERLGGDMPTGRIVAGSLRRSGHDLEAVAAAYDAPYDGFDSKAGARRFPWCIPFGEPEAGNAADQERCFSALPRLGLPIHVAFGDADGVFTWDWAQQWHQSLPGSTLDRIEGAGHFPQEDAPGDCLAVLRRHLPDART
ncbi:MAG: alpha/beta fold hydrolase [Actinobacteria bacterium]|nr:alpha/beta fold hydrolase [Actinomycetota bacterium]